MTNYRQAVQRMYQAIIPRGPFCRDCADHDGKCPHDSLPCDPTDRAIAIVAADRERLEKIRERLLDDDHPDELADDMRAILGDPHE